MADQNSFAPQGTKLPQGATQITMRPPGGPALGQHFQVSAQPVQGTFPGAAPQQQAQISAPSMPKGAQPVPLAASPQMAGAQQAPPVAAQQPFFSRPQQQQQQLPAPQNGADVHGIVVEGLGMDGQKYTAEFDAVFPRGTKLLGVRHIPPQG